MLSPFTDLPTPRHVLQGDNDDSDFLLSPEPVLPEVTISLKSGISRKFQFLLIVPWNLKVISKALETTLDKKNVQQIGTISILYEDVVTEESSVDEYDEQEQLYPADSQSNTGLIYQHDAKEIGIFATTVGNEGKRLVYITVPSLKNKIVYNMITRKILESLLPEVVIAVGTSEINNGETLNKLLSTNFGSTEGLLLDQVPLLKPPHFITGVSGSMVAQASAMNKKVLSLAIDAEGAFALDWERLNEEGVADAGAVLGQYLGGVSLDASLARLMRLQTSAGGASNLYL